MPVLVARLEHPVNTTKRLFILLPRGVMHHEGFFESLYLLKLLADRLGVEPIVVTIEPDTEPYERVFGYVPPELEAAFTGTANFEEGLAYLRSEVGEEDLVAALSVERGGVGWTEELDQLPDQLVALPPESFLILYPRQGEPGYDREFLRFR